LVLIGTKDCFNTAANGAEESSKNLSHIEGVISAIAVEHPTKTFVVFHEYNNSTMQLFKLHNIKTVRWSNIIDEMYGYSNLQAVTIKNKSTSKIGISLNRQMRTHRVFLTSYLYGLGLDECVHISALHLHNFDLMSIVPWIFPKENNECRDIAINGSKRIISDIDSVTQGDPYKLISGTMTIDGISNSDNFNTNLKQLYANSFVEIISETLYDTINGMVTEKYLNSVYGGNFPILISAPGTVQHLREMGFDMFDDIIDHSYDNMLDPVARLETAIISNINLIKDKSRSIRKWDLVKDRFQRNVDFARVDLYKFYETQVLTEFKQAINGN
jgi:hypothetical protein